MDSLEDSDYWDFLDYSFIDQAPPDFLWSNNNNRSSISFRTPGNNSACDPLCSPMNRDEGYETTMRDSCQATLKNQMSHLRIKDEELHKNGKLSKKNSKNNKTDIQLLPLQSRRIFDKLWRTMEGRMGLLFLLVLGGAWACDGRELANCDQLSKLSRKSDVCALCEEYTTNALDYLNENKTQLEIIDILHNTCYQLHSFKQKCITLVDYYAPLFFLEIATIQPGEFCLKVNLCQLITYISLQVQEDTSGFCEDTVSTLLAKLKDGDTKLQIIGTSLKVCNSVEKYAKVRKIWQIRPFSSIHLQSYEVSISTSILLTKLEIIMLGTLCKRMVFEYGPLVFDNAEKFLESTDICTAIYAMQIFNSGWPANLSFRFLWKQRSNRFVVYLLQKISIYITTH
ncbi:hypothetical protein D0Y65_049181 [Glycine soja]|uniref:Saposin B-type domain-containing protein n=1 Tax=Glycine soja TaxID=3848 RepID=A0A445FVT2_GLYSO|nr:hypothetical protein D0Y65_049181 [Glycine soja]RZB53021.1 hypothetical protein D0Y65_049181 [Glycine soja]